MCAVLSRLLLLGPDPIAFGSGLGWNCEWSEKNPALIDGTSTNPAVRYKALYRPYPVHHGYLPRMPSQIEGNDDSGDELENER